MKWWTYCCDQLFPGFKIPWLWVTQQCTPSTPPPISHNCRHISGSNWRTKTDPHFTAFCLNPRTYPQEGQPNWWLAAQYKNGYWHVWCLHPPKCNTWHCGILGLKQRTCCWHLFALFITLWELLRSTCRNVVRIILDTRMKWQSPNQLWRQSFFLSSVENRKFHVIL